jgi:hypothetical protein
LIAHRKVASYDRVVRAPLDREKLRHLLVALGDRATGEGTVYLTGGATAVLHGWRESTVDADLKLDPEPPGAFDALRELKDRLDVNVELASPDHFIPELPGWRDRSAFVGRFGKIEVRHYDYYAQALAKIERGHRRDLDDVRAMIERSLVDPEMLLTCFERIQPALVRYPALDAQVFREKVERFLADCERDDGSSC